MQMDGYTKTSDNLTVAEKGFRYSTFDVPARDRRDWLLLPMATYLMR
jgi:hypothetical protein